jgi:surface antigen
MGTEMPSITRTASWILASTIVALSLPAIADPPSHAPAHGWRAKQAGLKGHGGHMGRTGIEWELDYGVESGHCDRRAIATALGSVTGAFIANQVADGDNRTVATLIGAAAGALIGNRIGRHIDKADEACLGHALELAETGQSVSWTNESTGVAYQVIPGADRERDGVACREFSLMAVADSDRSRRQGLACQSERGVWQVVE